MRRWGVVAVLGVLAGCSAETGGYDAEDGGGDAQDTGPRPREDAASSVDAARESASDAGGGDAFNACPLKTVTATSTSCAPDGRGVTSCPGAGGHTGFTYSCAGSLASPVKPTANVGGCIVGGAHTDFGQGFVLAECDQIACTRFALSDYRSGTPFEICREGKRTAYACPRADVGVAAPPSSCESSGASWATGLSYGPLYCCD